MEEHVSRYKDEAEALLALGERYGRIRAEISKQIIGQDGVVESILNAIFSRGHALLVGVPGLAKTLLVQTLAKVLDLSFSRIQFTPDLMPSDITGSEILAMQEKRVTVGGTTYALPQPFFVLATQNPIEQEGTYPLPEAQLDRFMFQIQLDYPSLSDEIDIVKATTLDKEVKLEAMMGEAEIEYFQHLVRQVPVPDSLYEYVVRLVASTRPDRADAPEITKKYVSWGAGPRASQYLIVGAKCHAALHGKFSPDKEDVRAVALQTLRHRVVKNYKAEAEGLGIDEILKSLF